jgi:DNA-binding protein H-NS
MANNDLDKLSAKELAALDTRLAKMIATKSASERNEVRRKAEAMVREAGFRLSDIFGKGGGRKGKVAPKYRNPKNPDETWTGRGRRPRWMVKAGGDPKRYLIE